MVEIIPQKPGINLISQIKSKIKTNHIVFLLAAGAVIFAVANSNSQPIFSSLDNFVLFASEEIKLKQGVQVSSGDLGSNKEIDIDKDSIINSNLFADNIDLDKNVQINGNVSYNKLEAEKDAKIFGTKTTPVSLPIANLPAIPDFQIGDKDFKFEGQNNILPAGNYKNITLEKDSHLTLSGGVYNLNKLDLKENSILLFSAPTTLNIKKELKGQEHIAILPANNNLKPTDLTMNYQGKNDSEEKDKDKDKEDNNAKPVEFGKNSFLNFKLLAPKAEVHVGESSTIRGQILGRKVKVEKGGVLSLGQTSMKVAKPGDIVIDSGGGVYPINEILVSLIPSATITDAQNIATFINGRIIGVVSSVNLYQIEVQTRTITELENLISNLRSQANPKIDGIFRDFIFPEQ